jgi:Skp family chaperone for outer membrane proteins
MFRVINIKTRFVLSDELLAEIKKYREWRVASAVKIERLWQEAQERIDADRILEERARLEQQRLESARMEREYQKKTLLRAKKLEERRKRKIASPKRGVKKTIETYINDDYRPTDYGLVFPRKLPYGFHSFQLSSFGPHERDY